MSEYIEKFRGYLQAELMRSPLTVRAYIDDITAFENYLSGALALQSATYNDVRAYVMVMVERGDSPRSVNRRLSSLRTFFDFLILNDVVQSNPCKKIKALKTERRLPHFVEHSTMERVLDGNELDDEQFCVQMLLKMLYYTGMRRAELVSLDVESIDFAQKTVRFIGKGSKSRIVPLAEPFLADIERYLKIREQKICNCEQKALFLDSKGERIDVNELYRTVKRALTIAGVDGKRSPHILRHTFATRLTEVGVGVRTVQELLGHSSIATTQIYAHNTIETLKESYNKAHPRANKNKKL